MVSYSRLKLSSCQFSGFFTWVFNNRQPHVGLHILIHS